LGKLVFGLWASKGNEFYVPYSQGFWATCDALGFWAAAQASLAPGRKWIASSSFATFQDETGPLLAVIAWQPHLNYY
jgi:hypothetical protein